MPMTLVSTVTVGSGGSSSVEWTNIPQTGKDLFCIYSGRLTGASFVAILRLNNNSGANYDERTLYGNGSSVSTGQDTSITSFNPFGVASSGYTASTFGNSQFYISNYTGNSNKSVSFDNTTENNATLSYQQITAGAWKQTAAVTTVTLTPNAGSFAEFSTFSLYIIS